MRRFLKYVAITLVVIVVVPLLFAWYGNHRIESKLRRAEGIVRTGASVELVLSELKEAGFSTSYLEHRGYGIASTQSVTLIPVLLTKGGYVHLYSTNGVVDRFEIKRSYTGL